MSAITCDVCEAETAVMMQTVVDTGDIMAIGVNCLVQFELSAAVSTAEAQGHPWASELAMMLASLLAGDGENEVDGGGDAALTEAEQEAMDSEPLTMREAVKTESEQAE
jgi:hypothetical protein